MDKRRNNGHKYVTNGICDGNVTVDAPQYTIVWVWVCGVRHCYLHIYGGWGVVPWWVGGHPNYGGTLARHMGHPICDGNVK